MALLDIFRRTKKQPENRNYVDYRLGLDIGSNQVLVTPDSALTFSAVYSAVRVIAETIAQLPLNYFIKTKLKLIFLKFIKYYKPFENYKFKFIPNLFNL